MEDIKEITTAEEVSLSTPLPELEAKLLAEGNIDELNKIIALYNINIKRKDMVRTSKLNDLQDKITSQMEKRLEKNAGEFSNKDLLDYFKVVQETINKSDISLENVDTPAIQINQQVNINNADTELSRESRERVKNAIAKLLANSEYTVTNIEDAEVIE